MGPGTERDSPIPKLKLLFSMAYVRKPACLSKGMTLSLILLAAQVLVTVFALVRESGEDPRFEGDKLTFRS